MINKIVNGNEETVAIDKTQLDAALSPRDVKINTLLNTTPQKAEKSDLTSIIATGSTNTTGAAIVNGTYFYLNGVLCRAINAIAVNATFTLNTNYKVATLGGDITEKAYHKTGLTTSSNEAISIPINLRIGIVVTHDESNNTSLGIISERNDTWKLIHVTGTDSIAKITNNQLVIGTAFSRYTILYA